MTAAKVYTNEKLDDRILLGLNVEDYRSCQPSGPRKTTTFAQFAQRAYRLQSIVVAVD